ncbi:biotin transporter BioY [Saccharospirillum salsuginis]|uniref:Biotin transporter n=1 Tax=Saccharospirillum salsuginis TaxID=418750 RepID=A0A918NGU2_9GAMM|nr:biotin transporter BioY [Saccharospirillum salsuginis]GGX66548.1 BioY family transporter [Saccharospirillum salsuginis]
MKDKSLVQIALYAALIAALGLIPPVPFLTGIPITAQTLGVMLAGVMLGPWRGFLSMALFIFVVALGAPLLSGGRGGLGVFVGPTAGFAIGFPFAAFATGWVAERLKRLPVFAAALIGSIVGGILLLYVFGITGFKLVTGNDWLRSTQIMAVYIPGDLVKTVITAIVAQAVYKGMPSAVATR